MLISVFLCISAIIYCSHTKNHANIIGFDADRPECLSANISWMKFRQDTHCIRILDDMPECIFKALYKANIKAWRQNVDSFIGRNILLEDGRTDCESFMLTSKNISAVHALFSQNPPLRRFYPFTRIFIVVIESGQTKNCRFSLRKPELNYIYENGLEVFVTEGWQKMSNGAVFFREMQNVLTEITMNLSSITRESLEAFYVGYRKHPFLDLKNPNKTIAVASFNCSPNVIYFDRKHDQR